MITDLILGLGLGLLHGLISLMPDSDSRFDTSGVESMGETFGGIMRWANGYFPVYYLMGCVGFILIVRLALSGWRLVVFIYDRFPFKFT